MVFVVLAVCLAAGIQLNYAGGGEAGVQHRAALGQGDRVLRLFCCSPGPTFGTAATTVFICCLLQCLFVLGPLVVFLVTFSFDVAMLDATLLLFFI
jgi:hypothetical protein